VLGGQGGEELLAVDLGDPSTVASGADVAEIEVQQADISKLEVDAIANAANTDLRHGGGVAGAISRAGGPSIQAESHERAPIELGEAVETTGGEMPCRWVIHAATMVLGGPTSAEIIRDATASTLAKADELGARSLALVAFGTGVGGFPLDEAARIEVEEVRRHLEQGSGLERIVFAVRGDDAEAAFRSAMNGERLSRSHIPKMAFAPPARHLLRAKDLADARYSEPIEVADMAGAAGLSKAHFSREFRRTFGESPHHYLLTRRLERAASLLRMTDWTVGEICVSVGLVSLGSFTTSFKRTYGQTPTQYRAKQPAAALAARVPSCVLRTFMRPETARFKKTAD
jgi:O-acetyl-ADP-ribose deacetylase (regulator of RNase III)